MSVGCPSESESDDDTDGTVDDDTGDGLTDDDDSTPPVITWQEATVSEVVPTVVVVSWAVTVSEVLSTYVQFGPTPALGERIEGEVGVQGEYTTALLGLKPSRDYFWRVVVESPDGTYSSSTATFRTGAVPTYLPHIEISENTPESHDGYLVGTILGAFPTAVIVDSDGDYVWWYPIESETADVWRSQTSRDGEWMLILAQGWDGGDSEPDDAALLRVRLDGTEVEEVLLGPLHHDFVELADGTLTFLAYNSEDVDGTDVIGDGLVELRTDGFLYDVWSIWDHVLYDPSVADESSQSWAHANALDHDPERDSYLVSFRNLSTILRIDRASGEVEQRIGGSQSDFVLEDGGTDLFRGQHGFQGLGGAILVFDNGAIDDLDSRAVEYELNEATGIADRTWSFRENPPLYCYALGDVQRLPSGNTLVTWSTAGHVVEVTPPGQIVWQLDTDLGGAIAYVTWLESFPMHPTSTRGTQRSSISMRASADRQP